MDKKKYSIPIYENGIKTEHTVDFEEGDSKWEVLMDLHTRIPDKLNVVTRKNIEKK